MNTIDLTTFSIDQLIERFVHLELAADAARDEDDLDTYNEIYDHVAAIGEELKARGPQARLALTKLYDHPNLQVRLHAAQFSYGVAKEAARLQGIADTKTPPQYLDAGMPLGLLDAGISKLD